MDEQVGEAVDGGVGAGFGGELASLLDRLDAVVDALVGADLSVGDVTGAYGLVRRVERVERRVRAVGLAVLDGVERAGLHRVDGHASGKVLVRFCANLSDAEAGRRAKALKVLRRLPVVRAGVEAGSIGWSQVDRIARSVANPRVVDALCELDAELAVVAARLPYREFDAVLSDWERLADEDGTADRAERDHVRRDFTLHPNVDGSWRFGGGLGALEGVELADILAVYVRAEFEADWAEARARLGESATVADLCRTDAQRRCDAHTAIFRDAAGHVAATRGTQFTTNLVVDQVTFERQLAKLHGRDPGPDPRLATWFDDAIERAGLHGDAEPEPALGPDPEVDGHCGPVGASERAGAAGGPGAGGGGLVGFRCSSIDGHRIDPAEATLAALAGHVRRVVTGGDGVVVDMGRRTRLFTGPRHLAVMLCRTTCLWPGCHVPASACQADHLTAWAPPANGPTTPANGAPACGRHNRFRNHGFTVHRDPHGTLHVHRPDGTPIIADPQLAPAAWPGAPPPTTTPPDPPTAPGANPPSDTS